MKTYLINLFKKGDLDFGKLEKMIFNSLQDVFRHSMVEILVSLDEYLMENRDKKRYVLKEKNSRTIPTLFGEVTYKRRYYYDQEKNNWTYLLDERLKLESGKRISPGLAELVVLWATKGTSYRDARDRLADIYGAQIISHETIRQVLLNVVAYIEREDENKIVEDF